jgi:hypothetical protein
MWRALAPEEPAGLPPNAAQAAIARATLPDASFQSFRQSCFQSFRTLLAAISDIVGRIGEASDSSAMICEGVA